MGRYTDGMVSDRGSARSGTRLGDDGFGLVEAMIAVVLLAFGLLAVASITMGVAGQTRRAAVDTDQAFVAQQVLERAAQQGYAALTVGTRNTTVTASGHEYDVTVEVTQPDPDVREIQVVVGGLGDVVPPDTFRSRIHEPR